MYELLNAMITKQEGVPAKAKISAKGSTSSLRKAITELAAKENALVPAERRVTQRAIDTVAARSLTATAGLPRETRYFLAYREVAAFVNLAIHGKTPGSVRTPVDLDLLPIGHPLSTRAHAMTASALTESVARWFAADPRIADDARVIVASALVAAVESVERTHAVARLTAMTAGAVPQDLLIALGTADIAAIVADGRVNRFRGGNSRVARSFRARKQNRDRKKQFASGYQGIQFYMTMPSGKNYSVVGQFVANTDGYEGFQVEVKNDPVLGDTIVDVPSAYAEAIRAYIPSQPGAEPLSVTLPDGVPALQFADLKTHEMPNGWTLVRTRKEGESGPDRVYQTADGYEVALFDEGRDVIEVDAWRQKIDKMWQDYKATWDNVTWEADPEPIYKPANAPQTKTFKAAKPKWSDNDPTLFVMRQDTDRTKGKLVGMTQNWGDAINIVEIDTPKFDAQYDAAPVPANAPKAPNAPAVAKEKPSGSVAKSQGGTVAPPKNLNPLYEDVTDAELIDALNKRLSDPKKDQAKIDMLTNELKARGVKDIPGLEAPTDVSAPAGESGKGQAAAPSVQWSAPEGAHVLNHPEWFEPEGRIDEASPDYTDDPAVLANKFNQANLKEALAEALIGKSPDLADEVLQDIQNDQSDDPEAAPKKGKPGPKKKKPVKPVEGTGSGALPFDQGDEYVPAEALYLALQESGVDAEMFVAELYDAGTGETKNVDALNKLRSGETVSAPEPQVVVDNFDKNVPETPQTSVPQEATPAEDTAKPGTVDSFGFTKQEDGTWEKRPSDDLAVYYGQDQNGDWYFGYQKYDANGDVIANEEFPEVDQEFAQIGASELVDKMATTTEEDRAVKDVVANPEATYAEVNLSPAVVDQLAEMVGTPDSNPHINAIAASILDTSNELDQVLGEHIGLLLSDDPQENEAFKALWGVLMSLDGGFLKGPDRLENSMWGVPLQLAIEDFTGAAPSFDELSAIIEEKLGWVADWKKNKTDIANGDVLISSDSGSAALGYRLLAQVALPNKTDLWRGTQATIGSKKELAYTQVGAVLDLDPRSFSTDSSSAEDFAAAWLVPGGKSSIILSIKNGDGLAADLSSVSPFTNENESLGFGKYRVASVTKGQNASGRDVYHVELERITEADSSETPTDENYADKLIANGDYKYPDGYYEPGLDPYQMMDEIDPGMPEGFTDSPAYIANTWDQNALEDALAGGIIDGSGKALLEYPIDGGFVAQVDVEAVRDALQIQGVDTNELLRSIADGDLSSDQVDEAPSEPSVPVEYDISGWKKIGGQQGSNLGGTYEDENGNQYYVKYPKSDLHGQNEVLASRLYEAFGIDSAEQHLGKDGDGKTVTVSPLIPDAQSNLDDMLSDPEYKKKVQDGFAVDALLANWDVAGLAYDNIVTDENGNPVRVDPGGALLFRAKGEPKDSLFGNDVTELDTFRDPNKNPRTYDVFGSMTDEQQKESASRLMDVSEDDIRKLVSETISDPAVARSLADTLIARRQFILDRYGVSDGSGDGSGDAGKYGGATEPNYRVDFNALHDPDTLSEIGLDPDGDYTDQQVLDQWLESNGLADLGIRHGHVEQGAYNSTVDFYIPEDAKDTFAKAYQNDPGATLDSLIDEGVEKLGSGDGSGDAGKYVDESLPDGKVRVDSGLSDSIGDAYDFVSDSPAIYGDDPSDPNDSGFRGIEELQNALDAVRELWNEVYNDERYGDGTSDRKTISDLANAFDELAHQFDVANNPADDALDTGQYRDKAQEIADKLRSELGSGGGDDSGDGTPEPVGIVPTSETPAPSAPEAPAPLGVVENPSGGATGHKTSDGAPIVIGMEVIYKKTGESVTVVKLDKGNSGYVYVKLQDGTIKNKSTKQLVSGNGDGGDGGGDGGSPETPTEPSPSGESQTPDVTPAETPEPTVAETPATTQTADGITVKQKNYLTDLVHKKKVDDAVLVKEIAGLIAGENGGFDGLSKKDATRIISILHDLPNGTTDYSAIPAEKKPEQPISPDVDKVLGQLFINIGPDSFINGKRVLVGTAADGAYAIIHYPETNEIELHHLDSGAHSMLQGASPKSLDQSWADLSQGHESWHRLTPEESAHAIDLAKSFADFEAEMDAEASKTQAIGWDPNEGEDRPSPEDDTLLVEQAANGLGTDALKNVVEFVAIAPEVQQIYFKNNDGTFQYYDLNDKKVHDIPDGTNNLEFLESMDAGDGGIRKPTDLENFALQSLVQDAGGEMSSAVENPAAVEETPAAPTPPPGAATALDSTGGEIWAGLEATDKNGNVVTILKVNSDNYAYVQLADGKKAWRSGKTLTATGNAGKATSTPSKIKVGKITPAGAAPVVVSEPLDWDATTIEGTPSLGEVLDNVINGTGPHKGIGGGSAAVDSDSIEDLDVRMMHVRDENGNDGVRLKFKLTAWAANQKVKQIEKMSAEERAAAGIKVYENVRIPKITIDDKGVGQLAPDAWEYSSSGRTYEITMADGTRVYLYRANKTSNSTLANSSPKAFHNLVQIQAPASASRDQVAAAIQTAGVVDTRPATPADARILIENRLMSIFDAKTDATKNLSGAEREASLQRIKEKYGITPDDVTMTTGAAGRIETRIGPEGAQKIVEATGNPKVITHRLTTPSFGGFGSSGEDYADKQAEWLANLLSSPQGGLLSTTVRWTEGVGGQGMSSGTDVATGGADYVFTKPTKTPWTSSHGDTMIYFDPAKLYERLDFYANYHDAFGKRKTGQDIIQAAKVGAYELMFKNRIGFDAATAILVPNDVIREKLLILLHARGITEFGDTPIEHIIKVNLGD